MTARLLWLARFNLAVYPDAREASHLGRAPVAARR